MQAVHHGYLSRYHNALTIFFLLVGCAGMLKANCCDQYICIGCATAYMKGVQFLQLHQ
eukprot:COSAG02_NODE_6456_length_3560_cov_41.391794_4_plen_58_part_00